jgi:hypothetical protein
MRTWGEIATRPEVIECTLCSGKIEPKAIIDPSTEMPDCIWVHSNNGWVECGGPDFDYWRHYE